MIDNLVRVNCNEIPLQGHAKTPNKGSPLGIPYLATNSNASEHLPVLKANAEQETRFEAIENGETVSATQLKILRLASVKCEKC